jgi:hypothetical protein
MLLGVAIAPAAARVSPRDVAATHRYLLAQIALRRAQAQQASAALGVWQAMAARIEGECPHILAGTPLAGPTPPTEVPGDFADRQLEFELGFAVLIAPEPLQHANDTRFYETVKRLRWSSRALTGTLHALALQSVRQSEVPAPDLCSDLRYWVASGYLLYSPATQHFDHEVEGIIAMAPIELQEGDPKGLDAEQLIARRLRRYEGPADRRLARHAFPPARKTPAEGPVLEALEKIYAALGRKTA